LKWQEATPSSTTRVAADPDREKAAAISSSASPLPARQEATALSSPSVASDPNIKESGVVPSPPSLAQNQVRREEVRVPPSFPRNATKQVNQNQPATETGLPAFAHRQLDAEKIAVLLKGGKDFIAHGDFAAARVTLKRAAEANDAEAALALASTYDPFVLRELKVYGFSGDTAMARAWYEKAKELGSTVAPRRLEMLAREGR
jgi:TPR repeat protein